MDKESAIEILGAFGLALVAIGGFVGLTWLFLARAKKILGGWAAENGFQIISFDKKYMVGTGPFKWWTNSRGQLVYHVRVRDRQGEERSGWVRCGSFLGGVWNNKTEVRWDGHEGDS